MRFKELEYNVIKWANKKDLVKWENSFQQYAKFMEESNEILVAMNKDRRDIFSDDITDIRNELKDALGDTLVTLIILAAQYRLELEDCLEYAYNEIKDRTGKTVGGTFIKD